jgi:CRISPR-associated endonuclease/helicase Cas3
MPLAPEDFPAFFRDVHGAEPFPWQHRLLHRVVRDGWPEVLDLPTGSGKTAALDVALFALALGIDASPRLAPLRIVYVVDRRTIVDQAFDRAVKIRDSLLRSSNEVTSRVRQRLVAISSDATPLRVALLRGGIARDDLWARTPDQPTIVVSTVDQVGSRLLFRGYGVTDSMKPVHAGLLGSDVLYLLDEVHLSQPFCETIAAAARYRSWAERPLPLPFVAVEMSATPGRHRAGSFALDDEDRRHPVLRARLVSAKRASLVSSPARAFLKELEKHSLSMLDRPGATVAVVVNRVRTARELLAKLQQAAPVGTSVHLLTGRMRPFDRNAVERGLSSRISAGRQRDSSDVPTIVVATQCIEAGADFDFDGLVTECASLDALRQRFGRLDRLGRLNGSARAVIVARTDAFKDDPVYGDAIGRTWEWLSAQADHASADGTVDFGNQALTVPEDADDRGLLPPKEHAPVLLPSHLDAWVQTSPIPEPDPDIALWLHGPQRGVADVQVIWRADLTEALLRRALSDAEESTAQEMAIGILDAIPPLSAEAMSIPFVAAQRWLRRLGEAESYDVEGVRDMGDEAGISRSPAEPRPFMVWAGEMSRVAAVDELCPGQTIVVPASYGGIVEANWTPDSEAEVTDVAERARLQQGARPILRLHPRTLPGALGVAVALPVPSADDDADGRNDRDVVFDWLDRLDLQSIAPDVRSIVETWRAEKKWLRVERMSSVDANGEMDYFVVSGRRRAQTRVEGTTDDSGVTDEGRSSFTGAVVTLADHLNGVARRASGFAARLGLPHDVVGDLRRAGQWHDAGKADGRFQRWLHAGSEFKAMVQSEPLAKAASRLTDPHAMRRARERAGYPAGGRHELVSVALWRAAGAATAEAADDATLVEHLLASHHGHCRPFAPSIRDDAPVTVTFTREGRRCQASSDHRLERLDSGIADHFWEAVRRYGWWGLACLEACLRLADHRQSEDEQTAQESRRG